MPSKRASEKDIVVTSAAPTRHKPATSKRVKRTAPVVAEAPVAAVEAPVTQPIPTKPTEEQISYLAYSYWQARGCQGGSPEEDWLRAERELKASAAIA